MNDHCLECRLYDDDEYYDEEREEYVSICNKCVLNDDNWDEDGYWIGDDY